MGPPMKTRHSICSAFRRDFIIFSFTQNILKCIDESNGERVFFFQYLSVSVNKIAALLKRSNASYIVVFFFVQVWLSCVLYLCVVATSWYVQQKNERLDGMALEVSFQHDWFCIAIPKDHNRATGCGFSIRNQEAAGGKMFKKVKQIMLWIIVHV